MDSFPTGLGVILVDHGSRRDAANSVLHDMVRTFEKRAGAAIVEAAHMELSPPTLEDAFRRCVERGATRIVIHPYFLAPGRHSTTDIPALAADAAEAFPEVPYRVTEPLGLDPALAEIISKRVEEALGEDWA